jgi:superfamily II DNA/RNA helicase
VLQMHQCGILVLDEADQLLAPQFREEMARITGERCAGLGAMLCRAVLCWHWALG